MMMMMMLKMMIRSYTPTIVYPKCGYDGDVDGVDEDIDDDEDDED